MTETKILTAQRKVVGAFDNVDPPMISTVQSASRP